MAMLRLHLLHAARAVSTATVMPAVREAAAVEAVSVGVADVVDVVARAVTMTAPAKIVGSRMAGMTTGVSLAGNNRSWRIALMTDPGYPPVAPPNRYSEAPPVPIAPPAGDDRLEQARRVQEVSVACAAIRTWALTASYLLRLAGVFPSRLRQLLPRTRLHRLHTAVRHRPPRQRLHLHLTLSPLLAVLLEDTLQPAIPLLLGLWILDQELTCQLLHLHRAHQYLTARTRPLLHLRLPHRSRLTHLTRLQTAAISHPAAIRLTPTLPNRLTRKPHHPPQLPRQHSIRRMHRLVLRPHPHPHQAHPQFPLLTSPVCWPCL